MESGATTLQGVPTLGWPEGRTWLVIISGANVATYPLCAGETLTIGRAETNDVRIDASSVSREHAKLYVDRVLAVEDLGSVNGTKVDQTPLVPNVKTPFHTGTPLSFGSAVAVVQQVPEGALPTISEPDPEIGPPPKARFPPNAPTVVDPVMTELYGTINRVAASELDVLILGETGVGKELVAEQIHRNSTRASQPMVSLNCAALSETLLEAELFGHVKGAFTGADRDKTGILEAADGGTVFLDEIGELPLTIQAKLLRAVEAREIQPVGSVGTRSIDVRFVAATNRDLEAEVTAGRFRSDLLFRLDGMTIDVPPLRDRPADIRPLAERFLASAKRPAGTSGELELSDTAAALLAGYRWPGNVRELRKVIERAAVLTTTNVIEVTHLPVERMAAAIATDAERTAQASSVAQAKLSARFSAEELAVRQRILDALAECHGNQTRAAEILEISRRTFTNWLDRYDIPRPRKRPSKS